MTGQGDECVLQVGLLDAELPGDDPVPGQHRGDRVHDLAGARHQHDIAAVGDAGYLGQAGQQLVIERYGRPEPDALLGFETYTATLAGKGEEIDDIMRKADTAFASFDGMMTRIDNAIPDLTKGKDGELYQKIHSIHETADSFRKRSVVFLDEGRRTLLDISESAIKVTRKFDPPGGGGTAPAASPRQKRP